MKRFWIFAIAASVASPAVAQDAIMALNPTTMVGYSGTVAADQYARREFGASLAKHRSAPAAARPVSPAQFAYRPNAAVRQQVYARAVAAAQKDAPAQAGALKSALTSGSVTRDISTYLRRYGMSATNLADTTALYLALAWQVANGTPNDPSRGQMMGLRSQVAATLGSLRIARASDAAKQELSEANILYAAGAASLGNELDKDRSRLPAARASVVRSVMALYGFDLRKVTLTGAGFM